MGLGCLIPIHLGVSGCLEKGWRRWDKKRARVVGKGGVKEGVDALSSAGIR